eukprot:8539195-Pyramimonas_sp.AAC.1
MLATNRFTRSREYSRSWMLATDRFTRSREYTHPPRRGVQVRQLIGEPLAEQMTTFLALLTAANPDEVTLQSLASAPPSHINSESHMGQLIKVCDIWRLPPLATSTPPATWASSSRCVTYGVRPL